MTSEDEAGTEDKIGGGPLAAGAATGAEEGIAAGGTTGAGGSTDLLSITGAGVETTGGGGGGSEEMTDTGTNEAITTPGGSVTDLVLIFI